MARNPLDDDAEVGSRAGRAMQIGEVRTILAHNSKGELVKTLKITRTARDYVHDLCDAYNDGNAHPEAEYYVDSTGKLRFGFTERSSIERSKDLAAKAEAERQHWLYEHRNPRPL